MREILALTKRNTVNFLRDKASVCLSFLSVFILLGVYLLFIKNQFNLTGLLNSVQQNYFTFGYILGGVLVVNTITLSLGIMGTYVEDLEKNKLSSFFVTPLKRYKYTISIYITTTLITLVMTLIMFALVAIYLGIKTSIWYSFNDVLLISGVILLFVLISCPLMIFVASLIKNLNAFGAVSAIIGTLIGFFSGIYIPLYVLDSVTRTISTILPFSHMTVYIRRLLITPEVLNVIPDKVLDELSLNNLTLFNKEIPIYIALIISLAVSLILLFFSYKRITHKNKK